MAHAVLRNLDVTLDSVMFVNDQLKNVKRRMHCHLCSISNIRRYLDRETCTKVVTSLVLSRLDHCNSLLMGLSTAALNALQAAQNDAVRVIVCLRRKDHITPILE